MDTSQKNSFDEMEMQAAPASQSFAAVAENTTVGATQMVGTGGNHTLSAVDLSYTIQLPSKKGSKEKQSKTLIHPLTFNIKPREMVAIMGASGAGKSTLLDILAQRIPLNKVDGSYLLDGIPIQTKEFKRMSGYVMQDDALYPLLTVRETLQFAAELRIPNLSRREKHELVEETITQLKLHNCADTIVGNDIHRGVSGGERRRVSIGVDTVQRPTIIFLDEPTSGLDSTTALTIVETISAVCKSDRTVAMTIHQPSTRVLDTFDKVLFLSRGRMVYYGKPSDLPAYCQGLGKSPPPYSNIGEFFLEVVNEYEAERTIEVLSSHYREVVRMRAPSKVEAEEAPPNGERYDYANSMLKEVLILLRRQFLNVMRTPEMTMVRLVTGCLVSLVLGSVFWQTVVTEDDLNLRASYYAFSLTFFLFTSLEALPIFIDERSIYIREHSRGAYRVVSFSLANFLIYVPVCFVIALAFTAVSYFMVDFPPTGFAFQVLIYFMTALQGHAYATAVSGIAPDPITGNGAGMGGLAFMFLLSGFFISSDTIPLGWRRFSVISMFKYPYETLLRNMLDAEEERSGQEVLEVLNNFAESESVDNVDKWSIIYSSICFIIGFRILFYIALVTKHAGNRK